jgi:hypothetical protein
MGKAFESTWKMEPELKQKWVDALRSDKYKQGQWSLKTEDDCFCCLGVLCDIIDPHGWNTDRSFGEDFETVILAPEIRTKYTIPADKVGTVMEMNDSEGKSFADIADYIEKEF